MISLNAKPRKEFGKKTNEMRWNGFIPAVVYGPGVENANIQVEEKEFIKVLRKAGESSLVELSIEGAKEKRPVLINDIQRNPVTDKIIHIDFFQASLKEEVTVAVPLVFEGEAPAEKELGGTLNKNFLEIEVKALPQNLPHEITVDVTGLKTFEDHILVKDLKVPANVEILKGPEEIVAAVLPAQKVEEELAVPIEDKIDEVEKVEKEKKEEVVIDEPKEQKEAAQ
ncbi:MAG TPA: 50S ribosomal protein L25 [Negativicutes bacterium]|nr:50S ribosomal protein L25 [Negativicutes bacterium]